MRITHSMIGAHLINAVQLNLEGLVRSQERMSTGKKVNRPSDDPSVTAQIMAVMSDLDCTRQFLRNVDDGLSWLNQADAAMGNANELLQQARRIAVQGASGTLTKKDMELLAQQVDSIIDGMVDVGNTSLGGKYIFAGSAINTRPFTRDPATGAVIYHGNNKKVERAVFYGSVVQVNINIDPNVNPNSEELFLNEGSSGPNIFSPLFHLRDALDSGDYAGVDSALGEIDISLNWLMQHRVKAGALTTCLENLKNQMSDNEVRVTGVLSGLQDSDIAKASIGFSQKQLSYQAALSAGARMLQTSLLDYLR
jgi:flagellar hook-associated protein 3 FlgL